MGCRSMDSADCPDRAELLRFAAGRCSGQLFSRIARHVERCADCEATLQGLDHLVDPLLSRLRQLSSTDDSLVEPLPRELTAALLSVRSRQGSTFWPSADEGGSRLGKFEILERLGAGSFG